MYNTFGFNIRCYMTAFICTSSIFYWCAFLEDDVTSVHVIILIFRVSPTLILIHNK